MNTSNYSPNKSISKFAKKLRNDPGFMAFVLGEYIKAEGLHETQLINRLGTDESSFSRLAMCKRPRGSNFQQDLKLIAEYSAIQPHLIANIIRQVELFESFGEEKTKETANQISISLNAGFAAARDKIDTDAEESPTDSSIQESNDETIS